MNVPIIETPVATASVEPLSRLNIDRGAAGPVAVFYITGLLWLFIGSTA